MTLDYENAKAKWLEKHCFNKEEKTYIYFPDDSYEKKEELKAAGFRFSGELMWHIAQVPVEYKDKVVEISVLDVAELTAWGVGIFKPDVKDWIKGTLAAARPRKVYTSNWIEGEIKQRITLPVVLQSIRNIETIYGITQLVTFMKGQDKIQWWTTINVEFEVGQEVLLTGTIKKFDEFRGEKITTVTRCKLKEI